MSVRVPSVAVLKNRGVPITLHALVTDDAGVPVRPYVRRYDGESEEAEPVLEHRFLQFTSAVLSDLESDDIGFGSMDEWQEQLGTKPFVSLTRTVAIALEWWVPGKSTDTGAPVPDLRRAGKAMLDGLTDDYSTIVGTAFALANGVQPERALDLLKAGVRNAKELRPLIDQEIDKLLLEEEAAIARARKQLAGEDDTPTSPPAADTPGSSGSPDGSEAVATSTSSGD